MDYRIKLSEKSKERMGHVAVATLLFVAIAATSGCDVPGSPGDSEERPTEVAREVASGGVTTVATPTSSSNPVTEPVVEPAPTRVSYESAEQAYRGRDYGRAVELFGVYTNEHDQNPWGHYMLGLSAWKAGGAEQAILAFERALELDPNHVKSRLNLARVLLGEGRVDEAEEQVEEALKLDVQLGQGYRLLGRIQDERGDTDEAVSTYQHAITIDDTDTWSMNNLGLIHIQRGEFEQARLPLARAVELRNDVATFQNNFGIALEHGRFYIAATDAFRAALAVDEGYEKAAVNLTRVEKVAEATDGIEIDVVELARRFEAEVDGWRNPTSVEETRIPDELLPDDLGPDSVDPVLPIAVDSVPFQVKTIPGGSR